MDPYRVCYLSVVETLFLHFLTCQPGVAQNGALWLDGSEDKILFTSHKRENFEKHSGQRTSCKCVFMAKCFAPPSSSQWRLTDMENYNLWASQLSVKTQPNLNCRKCRNVPRILQITVKERHLLSTSILSSKGFEETYCTCGQSRAPVQFDKGIRVCWWNINTKFSNKICRRCRAKKEKLLKKKASAVTTCHKKTKVYHLKYFSCFFCSFLLFFRFSLSAQFGS